MVTKAKKKEVHSDIPVVFRGERRFYKVVGMSDDGTFYGLNVAISNRTELQITLVFACIGGKPPAGSPFTLRSGVVPFLACTQEQPTDECPPVMVQGHRLDKYTVIGGKHLAASKASVHLDGEVPTLSAWLDGIIEQAGLIPTFNDTAEVFQFFFGQTDQPKGEKIALDLPVLEGKKATLDVDFSQYGKTKKMPGSQMLDDVDDASFDNPHGNPHDGIKGVYGPDDTLPGADDEHEDDGEI
jgi:hypothetical protein